VSATRTDGDLAYLCRSLKAPSLADAAGRLGDRARSENWTFEAYLVACLEREVAARESHGGEGRWCNWTRRVSAGQFADYDLCQLVMAAGWQPLEDRAPSPDRARAG
jgi:hypothetical protein